VPIDYDPLLAKLIGYGTDRAQAIARLIRALNEYFVGGIKTNISLFRQILRDADFQAGNLDTGYLDRLLAHGPKLDLRDSGGAELAAIAAGLFAQLEDGPTAPSNGASSNGCGTASAKPSNWKHAGRLEALR
jgi:acetyl-CoA carboxylase, biotin carboxylase subunit